MNTVSSVSPIDGSPVATVPVTTAREIADKLALAQQAFLVWREVPAPQRGELIRLFGEELRQSKDELAAHHQS
jgi:aldehyde dehydrogenase (NAD+)